MAYRQLGSSGLKVSRLCLGTMLFGEQTDEAEAGRIIGIARDAGINFLDTANRYTDGRSEEICGRIVARERNDWVIATKLANPTGRGANDRGLSARHIAIECEASLRRLAMDCVDILYFHKEDAITPLEESVRAVGELMRQGKIRYFGLSNFRAWRIAEVCRLCDRMNIARPIVLQPCYNIMERQPEVEVLPACQHYGLGVAPYSPLARGVLSGKYTAGAEPPEGSRAHRKDKRMMETEWRPESLQAAAIVKEHAQERGITSAQFAIAWLLNNAIVTSPVIGPRTSEQMRDYLPALDYRLNAEDEALVDRLVATGHASTPGYNDPSYPIEGRPTVNS